VAGYCSPAGNKPLVLSGRLGSEHQDRRLAETGRFVVAVCEPDGLERAGEGFALWWDREAWGEPISQHDLLATSLLFSIVFVDGLRRFGIRVTPREGADWLHLWRWASAILGVADGLAPETEAEALRMVELVRDTQHPPDDDSRRLARAVLASPDARRWPGGLWLAEGFCRALIGAELADGLELPDTLAKHAVRAASLVIAPVDRVRAASRRLDRRFVALGRRWWEDAIRRSAGGRPLPFAPPEALLGVRRARQAGSG
jgi:hypothetical protein